MCAHWANDWACRMFPVSIATNARGGNRRIAPINALTQQNHCQEQKDWRCEAENENDTLPRAAQNNFAAACLLGEVRWRLRGSLADHHAVNDPARRLFQWRFLMAEKPAQTRRKLVEFDAETWHALDLLARDSMKTFRELTDEAFRDLLRKYERPIDLKAALRQSARSSAAPAVASQKRSARHR